ncbi:uncharacterized protein LOC123514935 [Portunus trituberculatus]|uniref:uncharacterized protein LOC123514935 n=1 Tax=Portunus trituberculatus TaxID=210409 RepID=UPI001E1CBB26|nr:uncharacterized protein LOC123514935 [Portunus trituberculatus]XP_045129133.1 uncharacterized protein LOC123514935 [Portunus trituberculatus]
MAVRMVAMVAVMVTAGAAGVLAGKGGRCMESTYRADAPLATGSTVWLYVFRLQPCMYHSGIGTRGAYWAYAATGQYTNRNYAQDRCNGPLAYWYKLGRTNRTKEEVHTIVSDLVRFCYPGYSSCWRFMMSHYSVGYWNCNYFTHHLAEALDVLDGYPDWLWHSPWPGFSC